MHPSCPACWSVHLPAHLLASPLLYSSGKGTFASELLPFQYSSCVLSPMLLICVQSVISELEYNIVFVLRSRTFQLLKVLSVRRKSSYALEKKGNIFRELIIVP